MQWAPTFFSLSQFKRSAHGSVGHSGQTGTDPPTKGVRVSVFPVLGFNVYTKILTQETSRASVA